MAGEDRAYSDRVRDLPCAMCGKRGRSEQHHRSGAGMGLRAHDHDSMPLCWRCHHVELGRMPKADRRAFEAKAIAETRAAVGAVPVAADEGEVF